MLNYSLSDIHRTICCACKLLFQVISVSPSVPQPLFLSSHLFFIIFHFHSPLLIPSPVLTWSYLFSSRLFTFCHFSYIFPSTSIFLYDNGQLGHLSLTGFNVDITRHYSKSVCCGRKSSRDKQWPSHRIAHRIIIPYCQVSDSLLLTIRIVCSRFVDLLHYSTRGDHCIFTKNRNY